MMKQMFVQFTGLWSKRRYMIVYRNLLNQVIKSGQLMFISIPLIIPQCKSISTPIYKSQYKFPIYSYSNQNLFDRQKMYQNLFITPNFKQKLNRLILDILKGLNIRQNQQLLNQYRKSEHYPLTLCQLLLQSMQLPYTSFIQLQEHKKTFISLQIKKISSRTSTDQCWRLMRQVYLTQPNKQIASCILQTCLLYHPSSPHNNLLHLFLNVDIRHHGILGLVRYLTFVHEIMRLQFRELQNETIKQYGQDVIQRLVEILGWEIGEFVAESVMTALVVVQGVVGERQCCKNVEGWQKIISKVVSGINSPLVNCLGRHFLQEISPNDNITITTNNMQSQKLFFPGSQLPPALHYCLNKTKPDNLSVQYRFYLDCIEILSHYWVKSVRKSSQTRQLEELQGIAMDVIEVYVEYFTAEQYGHEIKFDFGQQQQQQADELQNYLNSKRLSFLKTILYTYPQNQLTGLIQSRLPYPITLMQFSLYMPRLHHDNFIPLTLFETLLTNLQSALTQQTDTYLFIKQKSTFIWTLLKYVAKYYQTFEHQLVLRICQVVDYLVYKCDTIAKEGFQLLQVLVEKKLIQMEQFVLVQFLSTTLSHINQQYQWLQSDTCYFHAINILLTLSPELVFQRPSNPYYNHQFSQLQRHILTMTNNTISLTKKCFTYQTMHKLNSLLQHFLQPRALHLIKALRYDQICFVVTTNFKYQILTEASGDIYFYFIQFSENRLNMLESLDKYDFWKQCDSDKLIFFVGVYTKLIDSKEKFFTSSEVQHKVIKLRKHLWERFRTEINDEERQKIIGIFASNQKYFTELYVQAYQVQQWGQNRKDYWGRPEVRSQQGRQVRHRMEIQ